MVGSGSGLVAQLWSTFEELYGHLTYWWPCLSPRHWLRGVFHSLHVRTLTRDPYLSPQACTTVAVGVACDTLQPDPAHHQAALTLALCMALPTPRPLTLPQTPAPPHPTPTPTALTLRQKPHFNCDPSVIRTSSQPFLRYQAPPERDTTVPAASGTTPQHEGRSPPAEPVQPATLPTSWKTGLYRHLGQLKTLLQCPAGEVTTPVPSQLIAHFHIYHMLSCIT